MPYPDAMLLWDELAEAPPVRLTFARFVGWENKNGRKYKGKAMDDEDFRNLQMMLGSGPSPMPAHLKEAIGWAEEMKKKHPGLAPTIQ